MHALTRFAVAGMIALGINAAAAFQMQVLAASVESLDPTMAQLVSPTAQVDTLKNEFFGFTEGPVWVSEGPSGYLLFSDVAANCIYKWQNGTLSVYLEKSGFTGPDPSNAGGQNNNGRLNILLLGSNGLTLDPQGRLIIAQHGDRRLVRQEKDGAMTVLAESFEGKHINSPNDVVVKSNGSVFFTDPPFGLRGRDNDPLKELPGHGVFLLKNGRLTMIDNDPQGSAPNGLAFSPDERTLYVTSTRKLVAYDVGADDSVSKGRLFFDYDTVTKEPGGFDGIKVDTKGNVWGVGPGGIWAISPKGKALGRVLFPETPANLAFGDADAKTVYVTARRGLYRFRVLVPGIQPKSR